MASPPDFGVVLPCLGWMSLFRLLCVLLFVICPIVCHAQFASNPLPLNATSTTTYWGMHTNDNAGASVAGVGDVNGDGFGDFVIGAPFADPSGRLFAGQAVLVFGRSAPWPSPFELAWLNGTNGVVMNGVQQYANLGQSVAGVGDVNGDAVDDFVVAQPYNEAVYVVFGRPAGEPWPAVIDVEPGSAAGVTLRGSSGRLTGYSVHGGADVNGDQRPDIIIGEPGANQEAGACVVVFGRGAEDPWPQTLLLESLSGAVGFVVAGTTSQAKCGTSVAFVGDLNGDQVPDAAMACPGWAPAGAADVGRVAFVFGRSLGNAWPATLSVDDVHGSTGFMVVGRANDDRLGNAAVAGAGDVNADGHDDVMIGAPDATVAGTHDAGAAYVFFGHNSSTPWPDVVNVTVLQGGNGFAVVGGNVSELTGSAVRGAIDVNGDGISDCLVGVPNAAVIGPDDQLGQVHLLYGRAVWPAVLRVPELLANGPHHGVVTFVGVPGNRWCGDAIGVADVNADGRDDLLIGCPLSGFNGDRGVGSTHVLLGPTFGPTTAAPTLSPTTTTPTTTAPTLSPTTTAPTLSPSTAAPSTDAPTTSTTSPSTPATTTSPTTATPTTGSPTPVASCDTTGYVPAGAVCVNGLFHVSSNVTVPQATTEVTTSIVMVQNAYFSQPAASTLVFIVTHNQTTSDAAKRRIAFPVSTFISLEAGSLAQVAIDGRAVVRFVENPGSSSTDAITVTLLTFPDGGLRGSFSVVEAEAAWHGGECEVLTTTRQEVEQNRVTVTFARSTRPSCGTNDDNQGGLSGRSLAALVCVLIVMAIIVVIVVMVWRRRRRRSQAQVHQWEQSSVQL